MIERRLSLVNSTSLVPLLMKSLLPFPLKELFPKEIVCSSGLDFM